MTPVPSGERWTLVVAPGWRSRVPDVPGARALVADTGTLLHETERARVTLVRHEADVLVVKRSIRQERRPWLQVTSIGRGGEGARTFDILTRLRALGLPAPEPVLALERRQGGCVVQSWLVYRYVEGQTCSCHDVARIATLLARLHSAGWVHRDPHVRNFVDAGHAIVLIDCSRARPWPFEYARRYDVVLLDKCCPGACHAYAGFDSRAWLSRLAVAHSRWNVGWRRAKRRVRSWFGVASH